VQGPDVEFVALFQFQLAVDLLAVDEGAVGALEIPNKHLAVAEKQGAMPFADNGANGPQVTLGVATDQKLRLGNGDLLALGFTGRQHHQTQFHGTASLLEDSALCPSPSPGCSARSGKRRMDS